MKNKKYHCPFPKDEYDYYECEYRCSNSDCDSGGIEWCEYGEEIKDDEDMSFEYFGLDED